jgi:hypothetical protein
MDEMGCGRACEHHTVLVSRLCGWMLDYNDTVRTVAYCRMVIGC